MKRWTRALHHLETLHESGPAGDFCPFATDLVETPCHGRDHPARAAFEGTDFGATPFQEALDALKAVADRAYWRLTYEGTDIGQDFLDRFGCFCVVGRNAPFTSKTMHGFLVFMPPGLWYPWHQHPAEELYFVLAGTGTFHRAGHAPKVLAPGDAMFHQKNQPHALETKGAPILAYVLWRADFDTAPVLTPGAEIPETP